MLKSDFTKKRCLFLKLGTDALVVEEDVTLALLIGGNRTKVRRLLLLLEEPMVERRSSPLKAALKVFKDEIDVLVLAGGCNWVMSYCTTERTLRVSTISGCVVAPNSFSRITKAWVDTLKTV